MTEREEEVKIEEIKEGGGGVEKAGKEKHNKYSNKWFVQKLHHYFSSNNIIL